MTPKTGSGNMSDSSFLQNNLASNSRFVV